MRRPRLHGSDVRVGIVGCGDWGSNYARIAAELGVLAAVSDVDSAASGRLADLYGVAALVPDAMLEMSSIDAVIVAVPPLVQGHVALRFLEAGKHLLIEKPMAIDIGLCRQVVAAHRTTGLIAMAGHLMHFHPAMERMVRLIKEGGLGRPLELTSVRAGPGKIFPGIDVLWDVGPHDLSMAVDLLSSYPKRTAICLPPDAGAPADTGRLFAEFPQEISLVAEFSRIAPHRTRRFSVTCEDGILLFDDMQPWPRKLAILPNAASAMSQVGAAEQKEFLELREHPPLTAQVEHFISCIRTGQTPVSGLEEGLNILRILDEAEVERNEAEPAAVRTAS